MKDEAKIICAKLIPHTTSVYNVGLIAAVLKKAEQRGYDMTISGAKRPQ